MARPSHGIAKIGSVKVISFLESIETPESVRYCVNCDFCMKVRITRVGAGHAPHTCNEAYA